ncbi:hypothetical protein [Nocardioides hwasunensis]|uniref:WD40 repeat domain-containing protein n=1 Tax=Nocardioides hwasunensis TaxID=397258 RepID=A0ABR8MJM3_9ACTN|nr:hypothetical protein [Nocardioides hwasunensis]MBD3915481.1 hypothetical protein [Nocardioides hwasunensis]
MNDLRTTFRRLADSAEPLPVSDDLWQRAQASRRRGQVLVAAAVLAIIASVTWSAVLLGCGDREARTASTDTVPGGAIPSRIDDVPADLPVTTDLAVGRSSVAFLSPTSMRPVVIGAEDGRYRQLDLPDGPTETGKLALSPDGKHLAWAVLGRIHVIDLETGEGTFFPANDEHRDVDTLAWTPGSDHLLWTGTDRDGKDSGGLLPIGGESEVFRTSALLGIPSPTNELTAVSTLEVGDSATFAQQRGKRVERALPTDLYPQGATTRPLGWAQDHLVVEQVDAPPESYVEGAHLVLLTSPDVPESEWTYRILVRDVPQDGVVLSLAVDLVPDLDGTSSQQLTHDFGDPLADQQRDVSWMIGLGVAGAIGVLMGLRRLLRRPLR